MTTLSLHTYTTPQAAHRKIARLESTTARQVVPDGLQSRRLLAGFGEETAH